MSPEKFSKLVKAKTQELKTYAEIRFLTKAVVNCFGYA